MEFSKLIKNRHSTKDFSEKEVPHSQIQSILEAALSAPCAGNLSSYRIIVVKSQEMKDELIPACDYQEFVSKASVLLVFIADHKMAEQQYGHRFELLSVQDATVAATFADLAAANEGLFSTWITAFEPLEVSRVLQLSEFEVPVALLSLGHSDKDPEPVVSRNINELVGEI